MATRMYWLPDVLLVGLTSPIKSNHHFWNGSLGYVVTNLAKFWVNKLPIFWHWSQVWQYSWTSRFIVDHQWLTSKTFCIMILEEKWPLAMPPCNSCKIVDTCFGCRTQRNLLSCPNQYIIPFWSTNGLVLWVK